MKLTIVKRASSALIGICRRRLGSGRQDAREAERKNVLAKISHELRNPLGAIHLAAHHLRRAPEGDARLRTLDVLDRQLNLMKRLVDDLASLGRAEASRQLLVITSFDVQSAVHASLYGCQADAMRAGQTLTLQLPKQPLLLRADQDRFEQMLMNLVGNALKYAPGGNVTVSVCVDGRRLKIQVGDDGMGIAPEALGRIFDLFARESHGGEGPQGLGVGLAVVRELAEAHGGGVEAHSEGKGLGSVFTLRLPLILPRRERAPRGLAESGGVA